MDSDRAPNVGAVFQGRVTSGLCRMPVGCMGHILDFICDHQVHTWSVNATVCRAHGHLSVAVALTEFGDSLRCARRNAATWALMPPNRWDAWTLGELTRELHMVVHQVKVYI